MSPISPLSISTVMKELARKFSEDPDNRQISDEKQLNNQAQQQGPAWHDLRFVVKESVNLGMRFITEIDTMLKKLQD
ncbi:MAG: hypothetical protein HGB00_02635 [Chlorobiaceae bacterium]|nr:hypothetical protein [Chlorobiaceae bacterium]